MRRPERVQRFRLDRKTGVRTPYWRDQVRFQDEERRWRYRYFATEKEAWKFSRSVEEKRESGAPVQFDKTFAEAAEEFTASHIQHALRTTSRVDTLRVLKLLVDAFGKRKLTDIQAHDIEKFRDKGVAALRTRRGERLALRAERLRRAIAGTEKAEVRSRLAAELARVEGLQAALPSVGIREYNKANALARQIFKFCIGRRYCVFNPASHAPMLKRPPKPDDGLREEAVLTPAELKSFLEAVPALQWRTAFAVAGYGGLRIGELLGLRWTDVELERKRVLVRQQYEAVSGQFTSPKTSAGVRFISLGPTTLGLLKRWKLACPPGELDLVFPNENGAPMCARNLRQRYFFPALRRAKLRRIRFHDLRHTAASILIATGADLGSVSRQLGHASLQITTGTYGHWFRKRSDDDLGERMEALVEQETEVVASKGAFSSDGSRERA